MKIIYSAITVVLLLTCNNINAQGVEEVCSERATIAVKHKNYFSKIPDSFQFSLNSLEKANLSLDVKKTIREDLYFIYNRKELSDSMMYDLVLTRCFKQMK